MRTLHTSDTQRLAARWVLWRHKALGPYYDGEDELDLTKRLRLCPKEFETEVKRLPESARILASGAPDYPASLYDLQEPPAFIYIRGAMVPTERCVAVIGTRQATFEDETLTQDLVTELVHSGAHILSGGAIGIDIAAHRAALSMNQATTVVLPGGVDVAAPARHRQDFAKVLRQGGTLVSLQPLGTQAFQSLFAPRNAMLSALSSQVVVVRSAPKGGTMITVDIAQRLGRPIYAVPGDPREKTALGCLELLRRHVALPAWSARHILGDQTSPQPQSDVARRVLHAIESGRDHLDTLLESIDEEASVVHQVLLEMELLGVISRIHGRFICDATSMGELT